MFTAELAERLADTAIGAMCLNPGYNTTGPGRELRFAAKLERIMRTLNIGNPHNGAGLIARIATKNGLKSGGYYSGRTAHLITPIAPADNPTTR
ncbi:MAG: hypothetical protein WCE30_25845 [Mycobacterium sp.]